MASHIQFRIVELGKTPSRKIERVQDAVCAAKRAGVGARIVSTTGVDVTTKAKSEFGARRCRGHR